MSLSRACVNLFTVSVSRFCWFHFSSSCLRYLIMVLYILLIDTHHFQVCRHTDLPGFPWPVNGSFLLHHLLCAAFYPVSPRHPFPLHVYITSVYLSHHITNHLYTHSSKVCTGLSVTERCTTPISPSSSQPFPASCQDRTS